MLRESLDQRGRDGLRRNLREVTLDGRFARVGDGPPRLNLAGNDYLALGHHPALITAAVVATKRGGTGAGASRLVCGTAPVHAACERRFAAFKHTEAALLFTSGYAANLGLLSALARPGDLVVQDRLNHASLIDAARASGAKVRTAAHGPDGHAKAARRLAAHRAAAPRARRLVVTDAVFSMDGDAADLPGLLSLCDRHDAWLIVDEAHGTGVLGPTGAGLAEAAGVADHPRLLASVSTGSKALGGLGGVVTARQVVVDTLVNHARTLIYTTAPPPAQAAALVAALDVLAAEPERRARLRTLSIRLRAALAARGWAGLDPGPHVTPIVPLRVGTADAALALADRLEQAGVLAVAIRPPTVPPGTARVRLSLRCDLTDGDLERVIEAVGRDPSGPMREKGKCNVKIEK